MTTYNDIFNSFLNKVNPAFSPMQFFLLLNTHPSVGAMHINILAESIDILSIGKYTESYLVTHVEEVLFLKHMFQEFKDSLHLEESNNFKNVNILVNWLEHSISYTINYNKNFQQEAFIVRINPKDMDFHIPYQFAHLQYHYLSDLLPFHVEHNDTKPIKI